MRGYQSKWTCQDCGAIHWYGIEKCCRCSGSNIEKQMNGKQIMPKEKPDDELRLEIDPYRLEDEWAMQPKMYFIWAEKTADAQARYDEAKSELDLTKAELDQQIREDSASFGIDGKLTEKLIENCILTQLDYKAAVKQVIQTRHGLEHCKAAVNALEHKKRALSMHVELWIRSYYSEPQVKPHTEEAEEWDKDRKERKKMTDRTGGVRRRRQRQSEDQDDD